jgi:hypothetical protein
MEETIRSRLTTKQQIQLGEAEAMMKQEHAQGITGLNRWNELDSLMYMEKFECLARDFFTAAIADGWVIKHEKLRRGAAMLANQAVELLSAPYSDEEAFAQIDPLAPPCARSGCIPPQKYFPKFHERVLL